MIRLPDPCLVLLVGASGSGKSTWAAAQFRRGQVVASDALREMVGEHEHDQRAGADAFALLEQIVERRLARGLTTVVDTTGLDADRRAGWRAQADRHGVPVHVVRFDTPAAECRARNKRRDRPVPAGVLTSQLRAAEAAAGALVGEGYAGIHAPDAVRLVPAGLAATSEAAGRQATDPVRLSFGLQLPRYSFEGSPATTADSLRAVAAAAEAAGFESLWVMDHFVQIPQAGREWDDMLESYTTLAFLAAVSRRATLGTLVTGITYRNIAHLAKIVATLDVLSGGRAVCGLGAAWFEREHDLYGWPFPGASERYALLEDALQLLPVMWGKGAPTFEGRTITVPQAVCYPRPLQERVPILVGGGGERVTLKLVAAHADACNLFGGPEQVAAKVAVLRRHCADVGRDPAEITVTHLCTALTAPDAATLGQWVEESRPTSASPERFAAAAGAGTVDEQVGRFRALAEAGVQTAIVNLPGAPTPERLEAFAPLIDVFA